MALLAAASQFGIQPLLAQLKADALPREVMASVLRDRFATWHGISSILYLMQSGLGGACRCKFCCNAVGSNTVSPARVLPRLVAIKEVNCSGKALLKISIMLAEMAKPLVIMRI